MASQKLVIEWHGPYMCYGNKSDCVFHASEANQSSIYLWTIPFEGKYLVYYVRETGTSFVKRCTEHIQNYLHGLYRVYSPVEFAKGDKKLVWGGMWKPDRKEPSTMLEFLNQYLELSPLIYEFLGEFRLFLAPIEGEKRLRRRIESALTDKLLKQPGIIGKFQDSDIRYSRKRGDEKPINVTMKFHEDILGLCTELLV